MEFVPTTMLCLQTVVSLCYVDIHYCWIMNNGCVCVKYCNLIGSYMYVSCAFIISGSDITIQTPYTFDAVQHLLIYYIIIYNYSVILH